KPMPLLSVRLAPRPATSTPLHLPDAASPSSSQPSSIVRKQIGATDRVAEPCNTPHTVAAHLPSSSFAGYPDTTPPHDGSTPLQQTTSRIPVERVRPFLRPALLMIPAMTESKQYLFQQHGR